MKEFKLSEKMDDKLSKCENCNAEYCTLEETYFKLKDIKEFIKRLKEDYFEDIERLEKNIKLMGDFPHEMRLKDYSQGQVDILKRKVEMIDNLTGDLK